MPRSIRLAIAAIVGLVICVVVNMALNPAPVGVDVGTLEGLRKSYRLFETKHYILLLLAHSVSTFTGALVATLLTPGRTSGPAYVVGGVFMLGGFVNVYMQLTPMWFGELDLILAYLPAAWLAHRIAARRLAQATK